MLEVVVWFSGSSASTYTVRTDRTDDTPKVRFSATLGEKPDVAVALVLRSQTHALGGDVCHRTLSAHEHSNLEPVDPLCL